MRFLLAEAASIGRHLWWLLTGRVMTAHCATCGHEWRIDQIRLPMELSVFVQTLEAVVALGCPKCGQSGENIRVGSVHAIPAT